MEKTSWWWQDTKESVKTAVEKTQNFVEKIGNSIKEGLNECATKAKEGLNCLVEGAKGVWNTVTNFVEEHPFLCTAILIVGLAALTAFTGGAAYAILLAATKGAIMGAVTGFGTGVVTAGIKRFIYGDSYSFDDAVHDVGMSTFGGALTGAITGGAVEAGKQLWSKVGGKIKSALEKIAKKGKSATNEFPANPDDFLPEISRQKVTKPNGTQSQTIYTSDNVRIRAEQHPLLEGETFNPRHHGTHYHVEYKADSSLSWNNRNNVIKVYPENYELGNGTGFLPGEKFPGLK